MCYCHITSVIQTRPLNYKYIWAAETSRLGVLGALFSESSKYSEDHLLWNQTDLRLSHSFVAFFRCMTMEFLSCDQKMRIIMSSYRLVLWVKEKVYSRSLLFILCIVLCIYNTQYSNVYWPTSLSLIISRFIHIPWNVLCIFHLTVRILHEPS